MDYPGKVITKNQVTPTQTSATGVWTLDDAAAATRNNNWPVALVPNPISKSLRFNSADTAYLDRTPASAGNRDTWTYSTWIKRSVLSTNQTFFSARSDANNYDYCSFNTSDQFSWAIVSGGSTVGRLITTQVFRDVSSWYHFLVTYDSGNATGGNRMRFYVNGTEVTAFGTDTNPSQNQDSNINNTIAHNIGRFGNATEYCNYYQTETNFIDGQALTPSSFGMTNPQTGQWIPIKYSGTYGTNGFYLNFKDATSTTTLGYDYSGNANNWTTNNFSVTAGSGNDSLTDVPTPWVAYNTTGDVGGVIRGNYCTLNPLDEPATYAAAGSSANGNLDFSVSNDAAMGSTISVSSGKWYWEMTVVSGHSSGANTVWTAITSITPSSSNKLAWQAGSGSRSYATTGLKYSENTSASYGNTYTNGDVIGCALDLDNGKVYWSKNGTFQASGDPVAGTNAAYTGLTGSWMPEATQNGAVTAWNFGQRPFAYTPPAGFRSLCTTNLPATTVGFGLTNQANSYMDVSLWTGDNTTPKAVVTNLNFAPDFLWLKQRSAVNYHFLQNRVIGSTLYLASNATDAEASGSSGGWIQSLDNNGFTTVTGSSNSNNVNGSGITYVGWSWKAGGTGVTNTAGTITSTVSANTTAGFSIVTWTGSASASSQTVGHGLGSTPSMVILKNRSVVDNWFVYHSSATANNQYLNLNTTAGVTTAGSNTWGAGMTSTLVGLRPGTFCSSSSDNVVMYCFAAVAGYSAFGSYTGNGSSDGPFVYCGFRPRYILLKGIDASVRRWCIVDTARSPYNTSGIRIYAELANAEDAGGGSAYDIVSNGFKLRDADGNFNASSVTYIYAAFAEFPFQFANAR